MPVDTQSILIFSTITALATGLGAIPFLFTRTLSRRNLGLANALAAGLGLGTERARRLVEAASIDPGRRAETLSLAEFARLAATAG